MFELLLDFSGKALATALVLFLVSRVAERLGPFDGYLVNRAVAESVAEWLEL